METTAIAMTFLTREWVLAFGAFLMGASIGSFLNVCIYRLPLGISVNTPRRSFCPHCKYQIPMFHNIPILTWFILRAKCAKCKAPISSRYVLVEAFTGFAFWLLWVCFAGDGIHWNVAICYWIFISLLIVGTMIDIDHFIIPDEITLYGAAMGLICSALVPALMEKSTRFQGLLWSAIGAIAGFLIIWAVIRLGKLAFGKIRFAYEKPTSWSVSQKEGDEEPILRMGDEKFHWTEMFYRKSDRALLTCQSISLNKQQFSDVVMEMRMDGFHIGDEVFPLEDVDSVKGKATEFVIPREAMGLGDAKLMATIGAFLGWKAVLFTVFGAAIFGTLAAVIAKIIGREDLSKKLPFGPYLALGAVTWMFFGPKIVSWYLALIIPKVS